MSDSIAVAIITAVPPTAGIVVGIILAMRKIRGVGDDVRQVSADVQAVHVAVDSRIAELVEQKGRASHAEGRVAEREEHADVDGSAKE